MAKRKLFIVGGGWLGVELAQKLEGSAGFLRGVDITIFDKKKQLYNNISGLQACVEPDLVQGMLVDRGKATKHTRTVHAEVEAVLPPGAGGSGGNKPAVKLKARKQPVECDYVVIATGTQYSFPGKVPWWIGSSACQRLYEKIRASIEKASSVTIVGGGPVGCELTGAIASGFPGKPVRLIHKGPRLCSSVRGPDVKASQGSQINKRSGTEGNGKYCKPKSLDLARKHLEKLGVEVVLGEQVVLDDDALAHDANLRVKSVIQKSVAKQAGAIAPTATTGAAKEDDALADQAPEVDAGQFVTARVAGSDYKDAGSQPRRSTNFMLGSGDSTDLKTASGKTYPADLVFFCTGPIANSSPYEEHFKMDYRGRVCCDDSLRAIVASAGADALGCPCIFTMGDCAGTRYDDEQNMTAGHVHRAVVQNNLLALEKAQYRPWCKVPCLPFCCCCIPLFPLCKRTHREKQYKPAENPMLVLFMGRQAGVAEIEGMTFGRSIAKFKSPENIANMAWGNMKAGKPPKSEWQRKKQPCCSGCCCSGPAKDARVAYMHGDGDDDW